MAILCLPLLGACENAADRSDARHLTYKDPSFTYTEMKSVSPEDRKRMEDKVAEMDAAVASSTDGSKAPIAP